MSIPATLGDKEPQSRRIIEALYWLSYQCWRPCQVLGQTMFTLTLRNDLNFSFLSMSVLIGILKIVLISVCIWLVYTDETLSQLFDLIFGKITTITYFSQVTIVFNSVFADLTCVLAMLFRRQEVASFQRVLTNFLVEIVGQDFELETITVELLRKARNRVRWHQTLIFAACGYQMLGGIWLAFVLYFDPPPPTRMYEGTWKLFAVPVLMVFCSSVVVVQLIRKVSLVGMFHALETCTSAVGTRLINEMKKGINGHMPLKESIRRFIKLEKLVAEVNGTFGVYLAADILSLIVANAILSFHFGVNVFSRDWKAMASTFIILVLHIEVTWVICNVVYRLEHAAGKVIQLVKRLSGAGTLSNVGYTKVIELIYISFVIISTCNKFRILYYNEFFPSQKILLHMTKSLAEPLSITPGHFFMLNRSTLLSVRYIYFFNVDLFVLP